MKVIPVMFLFVSDEGTDEGYSSHVSETFYYEGT